MMMMGQGEEGGGRGFIRGSTRCQDCGNQAKRECVYMRCRTCCKSKGFQCQTHVKSTWVPLYRRRQRHHHLHHLTTIHHHHHQDHHEGQMFFNPKRLRQLNNYPNPPSSSAAAAGFEEETNINNTNNNFPAEVNTTATFHVVRVSSTVNDNIGVVDQYAYQTTVIIAGHVFKGILYDQGPPPPEITSLSSSSAADRTSSVAALMPVSFVNVNIPDHHHHHNAAAALMMSSTTVGSSSVADHQPLNINIGPSSSPCSLFPPNPFVNPGMLFFPNRK